MDDASDPNGRLSQDDNTNYGVGDTTASEDAYLAAVAMDRQTVQPDEDFPEVESVKGDTVPELAPEDEYFATMEMQSARAPEPYRMPRDIRDLGVMINMKLRLRQPFDQKLTAAGAWRDLDDSGTYDPKAELAKLRPGPKKIRAAKAAGGDDGASRKPKNRSQIPVRYGCLVKLSLTSEAGLNYIRSITPDPSSSSSSSSSSYADELSDGSSDDNGYVTCRREPLKRLASESSSNSLKLSALTADHPQLRGCKACLEAGYDRCSLLSEPYSYPCEVCSDAGMSCELFIPDNNHKAEAAPEPGRRYVSCTACRRAKIRCSLRRGQNGPCRHCREEDEACTFELISKSELSTSSVKPNKQGQGKQKKTHKQKEIHCRTPASFSKHTLQRPRGRRPTKKQSALHKRAIRTYTATLNDPYTSPLKLIGCIRDGSATKYIRTAFCHPITFNYIPDPLGRHSGCHFCASKPFYGLYGYGERLVEIITYKDGSPSEEVSSGHWEDGRDPTNMCLSCTFERMRICSCAAHNITPIADLASRLAFDFHTVCDSIRLTAKGGDDEVAASRRIATSITWCSVCPALAFYACTSPQYFHASGEAVAEGEVESESVQGCGLLFCDACAELFRKVVAGRANTDNSSGPKALDRMVQLAGSEAAEYEEWRDDGLRADVSFITTDGQLMVRMRAGMITGSGDDEPDGDGAVAGEGIIPDGPEEYLREVIELSQY